MISTPAGPTPNASYEVFGRDREEQHGHLMSFLQRQHKVEIAFSGDAKQAVHHATERLMPKQFEILSQTNTTLCARYVGRSPRTSTRRPTNYLAGASHIQLEFMSGSARAIVGLTRVAWQLRVFLEPQLLIFLILAMLNMGWPDPMSWGIFSVTWLVGSSVIILCVESRARLAVKQLLEDTVQTCGPPIST